MNSITHLDFPKKVKSCSPLESFVGVVGFVLVTILFIGCLFYWDYRSVRFLGVPWLGGFGGGGGSSPSLLSVSPEAAVAPPPTAAMDVNGRLGFLDEGGDSCDVYDGKWVFDDDYPLYQSQDCPFVDDGFRCLENGRPDSFYTKWRWQPEGCNLPRFNATKMLEKLRNKRLAFIGDSIGRNQWESMLCMLASAIPNKKSIYEVNGSPITKHQGFLVFMFEDYNCTIEYYRTPYLVVQGSPPHGAPNGVRMTLRLDHISWTHLMWKDADVLVFNTGHWWTYEKTVRHGCYFQEGMKVMMDMDIRTAFQRSMETLVDFIGTHVNTTKTQVYFRSYAPVHFRGGTWKRGGHCHQLNLPDFGPLPNETEKHVDLVSDVMSKHSNGMQVMNFMNVTPMTYQRQDGHTSLYHFGPGNGPGPLHHQDCSHWCLPGVPDSWNELLYALFLKRESIH
ncbi:hypothetical protein SLA2020_260570 [Shorea laevis]